MIREQILDKYEYRMDFELCLTKTDTAHARQILSDYDDELLPLLCAEIEKMGLSVSECEKAWQEAEEYWNLLCHEWTKKQAIAQAQLQKILNKLKEGESEEENDTRGSY